MGKIIKFTEFFFTNKNFLSIFEKYISEIEMSGWKTARMSTGGRPPVMKRRSESELIRTDEVLKRECIMKGIMLYLGDGAYKEMERDEMEQLIMKGEHVQLKRGMGPDSIIAKMSDVDQVKQSYPEFEECSDANFSWQFVQRAKERCRAAKSLSRSELWELHAFVDMMAYHSNEEVMDLIYRALGDQGFFVDDDCIYLVSFDSKIELTTLPQLTVKILEKDQNDQFQTFANLYFETREMILKWVFGQSHQDVVFHNGESLQQIGDRLLAHVPDDNDDELYVHGYLTHPEMELRLVANHGEFNYSKADDDGKNVFYIDAVHTRK